MAIRDKATLRTRLAALIQDNDDFDIEPVEVRDLLGDLIDSLALDADVSGAALVSRVDAALGGSSWRQTVTPITVADVLATILAGTQIEIDRSVPGQITIGYSAGQTGAHNRYAVWSASGDTPSAAAFEAGAVASGDTITVPATPGGVASYLHFADTHDQLTDIRETGSAFNSRALFAATPVFMIIAGANHYVYSSRFAINPYSDARRWTLTP